MEITGHTRIKTGSKEGYKYVAFSIPKNAGFEVTAILFCKNGAIENMIERYHICGGHILSAAAAIKETIREL
jgi:hypothetical protein